MAVVHRPEMKVVRELWSNYPAAGLTIISQLARRAGGSDPTMVWLASRLGCEGFAELQEALLAEIEGHLRDPMATLVGQGRDFGKDNVHRSYLDGMIVIL